MDAITVYTNPRRPCNSTPHFAHWIASELNTPSSVSAKTLRLMRHTGIEAPVVSAQTHWWTRNRINAVWAGR